MGNLHAFRKLLRTMAPGIALLIAILAMVTPFRFVQGFVPTPILPLIVVFLYSVYDPEALPAPALFALGILHDLLYGLGIGVWAAAYLAIQYMVFTQREYLHGRVRHVIWLAFCVATFAIGIWLWLASSFLAKGWLPIWPLAYQLLVTMAVYPLGSRVFFYLRERAREAQRFHES